MAITLDGYDILRRVGSNPSVFPALKTDLAKSAESLIKKQLKDKALNVSGLRELRSVIGDENLTLVIELTRSSELTALLKKLDKDGSPAAGGNDNDMRRHLLDLACSRQDPAAKPVKVSKTTNQKVGKSPKSSSPFGTTAMGVRRG